MMSRELVHNHARPRGRPDRPITGSGLPSISVGTVSSNPLRVTRFRCAVTDVLVPDQVWSWV